MVDSGNVWRCAVSEEFYRSLGLGQESLKTTAAKRIATAKDGATLSVLGEPREPLTLSLPGHPFSYPFQPVVVEGLSMDINISGPFMKLHGWDQLHSEDCLKIRGRKVALSKAGRKMESKGPMFTVGRTKIAANTMAFLDTVVPSVKGGDMYPGDCLLYTSPSPRDRG